MIERLLASQASVVTVIRAGRDGSVVEALVGDQARSAIESLSAKPDALLPLCEAAGMLVFQRSGFTEIVLFEGENVQRALSAMAGR
jgi:hypothetical protein